MSYIKPQITPPSPLKVAARHGGSPWRIYLVDSAPPRLKTRQKNPPIDWEGGRYAFGLAWLNFTTATVF
jgi:hypothetical protein